MEHKQILEKILKYKGLSYNGLAKELDIKTVNLYHIKNGRNKISSKLADLIVSKFENINRVWLLTGEGQMLVNFIKSIRKQKQITLMQLSKLSGIDADELEGYEEGVSVPDEKTKEKLAKALKVSVGDITNSNNVVVGNNNEVSNGNSLRKENKMLKEKITLLEQALKDKEEIIELMKKK